MKKIGIILLISLFLLSGCKNKLKELPEKPIVFSTGELNIAGEDTGYKSVINNDKVYIMYGGIKPKGLFRDNSYAYGECLGYINNDKNDRIYELKDADSNEWLIEYIVDGMMEVPIVLREITTKDDNKIPESVESFDYDYWR